MNLIVLDLEWNCPTVGKKSIQGLGGEIIQIGAVKIDENCKVLDSFDACIKPQRYTKMNKYVEKLTLITDEDLQKGLPIDAVTAGFKAWCGDEFVFLTWGPDDFRVLEENLTYYELDSDWLPATYDVQLMFDDMEMQEDKQWPLNYALYHFEEKPDGAHNALADSISTVQVLKHLDLADGLSDEYFRCDI